MFKTYPRYVECFALQLPQHISNNITNEVWRYVMVWFESALYMKSESMALMIKTYPRYVERFAFQLPQHISNNNTNEV